MSDNHTMEADLQEWSLRYFGTTLEVFTGTDHEIVKKIKIIKEIEYSTLYKRLKVDCYEEEPWSTIKEGLQKEREKYKALDETWKKAEEWFQEHKLDPNHTALNQKCHPDEFHIALITYAMKGFFDEFNLRTREIKDVKDVKDYPYKFYFCILYLAVGKVIGEPNQLDKHQVFYRGMKGRASWKLGDYVTFQQFVSTSTSRKVATQKFAKGELSTLFVISGVVLSGIVARENVVTPISAYESGDSGLIPEAHMHCVDGVPRRIPNGICMDHHNPFKNQQECLIWPLEKFKVTEVTTNGTGMTTFHLSAVVDGSDFLFKWRMTPETA